MTVEIDKMSHVERMSLEARGSHPRQAAVEMLARAFDGRFAAPGWPWVGERLDRDLGVVLPSLQPQEMTGATMGALSDGEQRFLRIVASVAGASAPIVLADELWGMDRAQVDLVLAGISHATGSHEYQEIEWGQVGPDGRMLRGPVLGALHPWPGRADRPND